MPPLPKKILHAARIELAALREIARHGFPDSMLQFLGGIGDELLLTAVAHELRARHSHVKIWQVSHSATLLQHNPDYHAVFSYDASVQSYDSRMLRYAKILDSRRVPLSYSIEVIKGELEIPPGEHIVARLCRKAGISGPIRLRPYCYLTDDEKAKGKIAGDFIVLQNVGDSTHQTFMKNKKWYSDRFQNVIDSLKNKYRSIEVVQIGTEGDVLLDGVIDLRGKTTLRESAAILSNAKCFIGTSGLLKHLARAVDTRSVIIYGGREHSHQTGYICNENLNSYVDCAPCWHWNLCDYDKKCMQMISSDMVVTAAEKVLDTQHQPLLEETVIV
ncbi:MAG: glycosyltransferase family 9 protein [Ignavibacteriales bacterium]|nr:glycosyltransferase family 9 protein [Ignavibacteriales bacterium]